MFYKVWITLNHVFPIASAAILAWKAVILVKIGMFPKSALFNALDIMREKKKKICRSFVMLGLTSYYLYTQDKRQRNKIFRY